MPFAAHRSQLARVRERSLGRQVVGLDPPRRSDPGYVLLRELASSFRAGAVVTALPKTSELIVLAQGPETLIRLLGEFWSRSRPKLVAAAEASAFAAFLRSQKLDIERLQEVLAAEISSTLCAE